MENLEQFKPVLATVMRLLVAEGLNEAADLVRTMPVRADYRLGSMERRNQFMDR